MRWKREALWNSALTGKNGGVVGHLQTGERKMSIPAKLILLGSTMLLTWVTMFAVSVFNWAA